MYRAVYRRFCTPNTFYKPTTTTSISTKSTKSSQLNPNPLITRRRLYRNRRDAENDAFGDQNHQKPDTLAYIKQNQTALYQNQLGATPANPGSDPKAGLILPNIAEFAAKQEGIRAKMNFIQKLRFNHPFTKPMKLEEDIPMIIDNNDPKVAPQLFLPRSTYPLYRLWDIPDVIPMPRKDAIVPFLTYASIGMFASMVIGIPKVVDFTADAEKKHLILQKEVKIEEEQLHFLYSQMTIEEVQRAMETLPRMPGETWNPDEEEEMERLRKRVFYPN